MSEYEVVRKGKLKLKGEAEKSKKRKHKKEKKEKTEKAEPVIVDQDCINHGGWWKVKEISELVGSVCIQFGDRRFVKSVDDGTFTIGAPHNQGEGPAFDEEFTAFTVNDTKVCFKSGYGKYLRVEKNGVITGRTEAIGPTEQFESVFDQEGGKMALQAANDCFLSIDDEDDQLVAVRKKAGENEFCIIRSNAYRGEVISSNAPIEEKIEDLNQVELNYVKKFQKFQDKKIKICQDSKKELEKAKETGKLHEALLDRRSLQKADRYCK